MEATHPKKATYLETGAEAELFKTYARDNPTTCLNWLTVALYI
jgi:hypothetical protein